MIQSFIDYAIDWLVGWLVDLTAVLFNCCRVWICDISHLHQLLNTCCHMLTLF